MDHQLTIILAIATVVVGFVGLYLTIIARENKLARWRGEIEVKVGHVESECRTLHNRIDKNREVFTERLEKKEDALDKRLGRIETCLNQIKLSLAQSGLLKKE